MGTFRERQLNLSGLTLTVFHRAGKLASVFFAFSASISCQELLPCWVGLSDEWKTKGAQRVVNYCRQTNRLLKDHPWPKHTSKDVFGQGEFYCVFDPTCSDT